MLNNESLADIGKFLASWKLNIELAGDMLPVLKWLLKDDYTLLICESLVPGKLTFSPLSKLFKF